MLPPQTPADGQVRSALAEALREVYDCDGHLFTTLAGERAVVHKLCVRLTPVVEAWAGGWTVDARIQPDVAYNPVPGRGLQTFAQRALQ